MDPLMRMPVLTNACTYTHVDTFLLLLLLTVSSPRCVAFTPNVGIEASAHLGSLLHRSGSLSGPTICLQPSRRCSRSHYLY
ncbi:uncharacterized protein HD556DRAFT_1398002 [Suillus plorans]|uniref:Secreted protein n=1 Tax=Suillus plorans TaxID=116603 RepID=A0A9P7AH90_9AGAM|nr:uncharacterized protein HD556DRAFT_1398002 [Suillus plorans]KAG1789402.1 hypothetical protein HD556DRAFT_1398002 [Suillus plorans]